MPVATPEQYVDMLEKAKAGGFAYPAINVSSSSTINAVLQGLTEAGSDGIIQVTTGGADYFAGHSVKNRASGAIAFAKFATEVAKNYPVTIALHTDHCAKDALDGFVIPLIEASEAEVAAGRNPLFQSHMWDGSAVPLAENEAEANPGQAADDLLEAVRYYADLAPGDYTQASVSSSEFAKYKAITLEQCASGGSPQGDDGGAVFA